MDRRMFLLLPAMGLLPLPVGQMEVPPPAAIVNRVVFGGDVMMSRYVGTLARAKHDPAFPMRDIAGVFSAADIAFVNLEAPFSDRGAPTQKGMIFKAGPDMVEALQLAGIDVASTANNHTRDCGSYGITYTVDWLSKHGITAVGTGVSAEAAHQGTVVERHGVRFGFLAYTFDQSNGNYKDKDDRVAMIDPKGVRVDVAAMLRHADVVIVSMHAGIEYRPKPNAEQVQFAHAAIDAGATIVVGHHPHVVQPVEEYGGGVIFYSLGNLVFDQFQRKETQEGLIGEALFVGKVLVKYHAIPVDIVKTAPRVREAKKENVKY